jgi:hypothetical protein
VRGRRVEKKERGLRLEFSRRCLGLVGKDGSVPASLRSRRERAFLDRIRSLNEEETEKLTVEEIIAYLNIMEDRSEIDSSRI